MRFALLLLAPLLTASEVPPSPQTAPSPSVAPDAPSPNKNCQGRIETVREERGLPMLKRDNAPADEPLIIAAVDKRIDGCEVLVLKGNINDVRPLPEFHDGPARIRPLH
jgi:hypothetical protein